MLSTLYYRLMKVNIFVILFIGNLELTSTWLKYTLMKNTLFEPIISKSLIRLLTKFIIK